MSASKPSRSVKYDTVGFHNGCKDGHCGAAIVKKWSPDVRTVWLNVGPEGTQFKYPDMFMNKHVIYVDLCPSLKYLCMLAKVCKSVTVLDHHFGTPQYDEINTYLAEGNQFPQTVTIVLDKDMCGAMIAWRYLFPDDDIPDFVMYVDDQDRWIRELPDTEEINTAIAVDYNSIEGMEKLFDVPLSTLYERGKKLWEMQTMIVDDAVKKRTTEHTHMFEGRTLRCYLNSGPYQYRSFICDKLLDIPMKNGQLPDFAAVVCYDLKGHRFFFSLRGREDRVACSEICKAYGHGGHRNAAGMELPASRDPKEVFPLL